MLQRSRSCLCSARCCCTSTFL